MIILIKGVYKPTKIGFHYIYIRTYDNVGEEGGVSEEEAGGRG